MRILNFLFVFFVTVLIVMSIIALIAIHMTLSEMKFSFTPKGLNSYLSAYKEYSALFAGTITVTGVYFGLLRVHAATDANRDKLRQDRFSEWKTTLDIRMIETDKPDPYMKREFVRLRWQFFLELYSRNFTIKDKDELFTIFTNVFKSIVPFFEEQNNRHIGMGGSYPDKFYSYSFDSFRFLFLGSIETFYDDIVADLKELYLGAMKPDRLIDRSLYEAALKNYRPISR